MAPDGWTLIAFLDRELADPALFEDPSQIPAGDSARYHIMVIDGADLSFQLVEYGDTLPRYDVTADGSVVLIDAAYGEEGLSLLDLASLTYREVSGPVLYMDNYAQTRDGSAAYVLHDEDSEGQPGLFLLDTGAAAARQLALDFTPSNLNLSPTDDTLFLRKNETRICIYDIAGETCRAWFKTDLLAGRAPRPDRSLESE